MAVVVRQYQFSTWTPDEYAIPDNSAVGGWIPSQPDRPPPPHRPQFIPNEQIAPLSTVTAGLVNGWMRTIPDWKYEKPLNAALQQFTMWPPKPPTSAPAPAVTTLLSIEFGASKIRPVNAALQQFAMWSPPNHLIPGVALRNVILPKASLTRED